MNKTLQIPVVKGDAHGIKVYRGFAMLSDLAAISKADIYDQDKNPAGTQRDLSIKHAKEAYEYITQNEFGFWTEVLLCVREKDAIKFTPQSHDKNFGYLTIDAEKIRRSKKIIISRVDGNHRLHFAAGEFEGFKPVEKQVSFCIAYEMDKQQEISLFRDINANVKSMNTSHLDNITMRLDGEEKIKVDDRELYIAFKLGRDPESPWYGLVHEGGVRPKGTIIPERTLQNGIKYMFSASSKIRASSDVDAQYILVRNFFSALKQWLPDAWKKPQEYILLRGAGLWAACMIGAEVIDKVLSNNRFQSEDVLKVLNSGRTWNWKTDGNFAGYSGAGGAKKIADTVIRYFKDEDGKSLIGIFDKIIEDDKKK